MTHDTTAREGSRIRYVVNAFWACAWYRAHVPGRELQRLGHEVILDDKITREDIEEADVVVFQSGASRLADAVTLTRSRGKLAVYDLDDDLWALTPDNQAYASWQRPGALEALQRALGLADLVTTTTPALAAQLRRFNPRVTVLPNMLPEEYWRVERASGAERLVMGWAGSAGRHRDLQILSSVVPQVLDAYPHVEFRVTGPEHLPVFPSHPRVSVVPNVPIEEYASLLAQFDIGLAPLRDDRFNAAKSDLKFIEHGILGIPTIASHLEPYSRSIANGENGFLAKNAKDWLKYLRRLIEDAELRRAIGERAREFAEKRTIARNIHLWEKAYGLSRPGVSSAG